MSEPQAPTTAMPLSSKRQIIYTSDTLTTSCASSPRSSCSPTNPTSPITSHITRYSANEDAPHPPSSPQCSVGRESFQSGVVIKSQMAPPVDAAPLEDAPSIYLPIITSLQEDLATALADLAASEAREKHWRQRAQRAEALVQGLEVAVSTWQKRYQEMSQHVLQRNQGQSKPTVVSDKNSEFNGIEGNSEEEMSSTDIVPSFHQHTVNTTKNEPEMQRTDKSDTPVITEEELERKMLELNVEKSSLERELAKFPYGTAGRTVGQRHRKMAIENRLQVLDKELNTVRKGLRRLGCI